MIGSILISFGNSTKFYYKMISLTVDYTWNSE